MAGGSSAPFEAQYRRRSAAARDVVADHLTALRGGSLHVAAAAADAPLLVFVHGGYWQALSAADSLFPAAELAAAGWSYAAVEYTVAPRGSIDGMVAECTQALRELATEHRRRVVLVGHSAGAHLVAMAALAQRPPMVVDAVVLLSGVFDLRPLVGTSINAPLGLDDERAMRLSPLLMAAQPHPRVVVAWGENETSEFKRQSREYALHVRGYGSTVLQLECGRRNHFDIVFDLAEPASELGALVLDGAP